MAGLSVLLQGGGWGQNKQTTKTRQLIYKPTMNGHHMHVLQQPSQELIIKQKKIDKTPIGTNHLLSSTGMVLKQTIKKRQASQKPRGQIDSM